MRLFFIRGAMSVLVLLAINVPVMAQNEWVGRYGEGDVPNVLPKENRLDMTLPSEDAWWRSFGDTTLDSLIAEGEANNFNVRIAMRRMAAAQQTVNRSKSSYYPTLAVEGGWSKSRGSGAIATPTGPASTMSSWDLGLSMNWEIDVFGKITAQVKQSKAAWNATRAQHAAAMVTMASQIASTYFQLRMFQAEKAVTEEHIKSQGEVVKIVEARYESGLADKLELSQARTVYYSSLATIPGLNSSIGSAINALAVLTGTSPDVMRARLSVPSKLPDYKQIIATDIPMELLRRRPDIVEAEYTIAGQAAALGVAKKDYLPSLSFSGSIGTQAHDGADLFSHNSLTYSIAPTLSWTLFDGFARRATVAGARENMMASIESYNLTVLTAVEEVENAMLNYREALKHTDALQKVVDQSMESLKLSLDLYKGGLEGFYNVVDAQLNFLNYSNALIASRGAALTSLVDLYRAFGGGWMN